MIYHVVSEPFSTRDGLALAAMAANILHKDEESIVVCTRADDSYGLPASRIIQVSLFAVITWIRGWHYVPVRLRRLILLPVFAQLMKRLRPDDVVWFHNWNYIAEALAEPVRLTGASVVYHAHNSHLAYAAEGGFRKMRPDLILFCSEMIRQEVLRIAPETRHTHTVHNGVSEAFFYPSNSRASGEHSMPVILFAGRLVPYKGAHILLRAMHILQQRNVSALCKIIGSSRAGILLERETAYVKQLHAEKPDNVEMFGFCAMDVIGEHYRSADVFCCPSIWNEPFGNVNIEAMACGVPVVASSVGGIPEIAATGGVLLIEPDSPLELADALQLLLQDAELRAKVGQEARDAFLRNFTSDILAEKALSLVRELSSGKNLSKLPGALPEKVRELVI